LPILGLEEERIAWFEDNYAKVMAAPALPPRQPAAAIMRNAGKVAVITDQVGDGRQRRVCPSGAVA
jgi:hypothetical protein